MIGVPPHNCSICYQPYNNERSPLILITCGHTFCKECLEMIFLHDTKEIPCPECKQSTYITEPKALPKNRSLLDVIIYHEEIRYSKRTNSNNDGVDKGEKTFNVKFGIEDKIHNLLCDYANILNKLEETYNKILEDHSYLTEISDVLITKEVDEVLDNLIDVINQYRNTLHSRIKSEFEKVNLIKDFKVSLNMYKNKLNMYSERLSKNEKDNKNIPPDNNDTDNIQNESKTLTNVNVCEDEIIEFSQEEIKKPLRNSPDNNKNTNEEYPLILFEIENLQNEIKFAELYSITLKHYSKEIYNPCKYFFINKFQIEKLTEDLRKLLQKMCDFDENVFKFNLESFNINDEKKLIKEIQEACNQSNYRKLKFIFSHLRINPNFIYSDVLDHITYQTVSDREVNSSSSKILISLNSFE